jgi:alginate O-acetyltransferase complex protein AlgI
LNPTWEDIQVGSRRFIIGLAKKVIIADQLAVVINAGFGLPTPAFSTSIAWLLIIAFLIQIYYDFSGYIDMGIGLARIMGIVFPENFNSPYLSLNVTEFWRRWHMTLIAWFRDYLFYPLEFRRRKEKYLRQESNTIIIFILTGLWHGLTINYLIWGVLQGLLISFENSRFGKWIKRMPTIFQRLYFFSMILVSWVVFRSESLGYALRFFKRLIIVNHTIQFYPYAEMQPLPIINNSVIFVLVIGIVGLLPIRSFWSKVLEKMQIHTNKADWIFGLLKYIGYVIVFVIAIALLASQSFVPNIYGRY